jgi:hypothetical protein
MFIAAISLVMALQAQQLLPSGTVKGVVTAAGKPVPAVKIVFSSGADSSYAASATTDSDGTFSVAQVPVGSVELRVFGPDGKLAVSGKGELKAAGDVLTLPIQLP